MNGGRITQVGTTLDINERPADTFVADFIGATIFLLGQVAQTAGGQRARRHHASGGQRITVQAVCEPAVGTRVTLAYRPEQMRIADGTVNADGCEITIRVDSRSYVGGRWQVDLDLGGALAHGDRTVDTRRAPARVASRLQAASFCRGA